MSLGSLLAVAVAGAFSSTILLLPHDPGLSSVHVRRTTDAVLVHAAFANADFLGATAGDRDGDGALDANELADEVPQLHRLARDAFVLQGAIGAVGGELLAAAIAENRDVELTLRFPATVEAAELRLPFLTRLAHGHRCYTVLHGDGDGIVVDALLAPAAASFALPASSELPATRGFGQAWRFFELGVEHILIGFDHLAFLLALLAAGVTWRRVLATITAFTAAHSVTLLAAALGLVRLPSLLVEASIAASIVVVAIVNLWQRGRCSHRWPLAAGFGLLHGFGFAGVLADLDIGGPDMLVPLLTFNLGVEAGQLAFAAVAVPLLALAVRHPRTRSVPTLVSVAVGVAGVWWLHDRLLG